MNWKFWKSPEAELPSLSHSQMAQINQMIQPRIDHVLNEISDLRSDFENLKADFEKSRTNHHKDYMAMYSRVDAVAGSASQLSELAGDLALNYESNRSLVLELEKKLERRRQPASPKRATKKKPAGARSR